MSGSNHIKPKKFILSESDRAKNCEFVLGRLEVRNSTVPENILRAEARRFEGEAYKSATDEDHYLTTLCYVTRNAVSKKRIIASFEEWKTNQPVFGNATPVDSPVGLPSSGRSTSFEGSRPSGYISDTQSESSTDFAAEEASKSVELLDHPVENTGPSPVRLSSLPASLALTTADGLVDSFAYSHTISLDGSAPGTTPRAAGPVVPVFGNECPDAIMADSVSPACRNPEVMPAVPKEPDAMNSLKAHGDVYLSKLKEMECLLDRCSKREAEVKDFVAVLDVKRAAMGSLRQAMEALEFVEKSVVDQMSAVILADQAQCGTKRKSL